MSTAPASSSATRSIDVNPTVESDAEATKTLLVQTRYDAQRAEARRVVPAL